MYFLGFRSWRTFHLAGAQRAAPAFVRDVLAHVSGLVEDASTGSAIGDNA